MPTTEHYGTLSPSVTCGDSSLTEGAKKQHGANRKSNDLFSLSLGGSEAARGEGYCVPFFSGTDGTSSHRFSRIVEDTAPYGSQGNILSLLDKDGNTVVKYTYDAWGNHTVEDSTECGLGTLNPFRYRGYYYDTETGLYYLQTRYYDPEIGRFITIDDVAYLDPDTVGGLNLYAYCNNNPVMCVDPMGTSTDTFGVSFIGGIGVGIGWGVGLSSDSNGMDAFQYIYDILDLPGTRNIMIGAGIGVAFFYQHTNWDSISDLEERPLLTIGINTPAVGFDLIFTKDFDLVGYTIGVGPYFGLDIHLIDSKTGRIGNAFRQPLIAIKEWLGM